MHAEFIEFDLISSSLLTQYFLYFHELMCKNNTISVIRMRGNVRLILSSSCGRYTCFRTQISRWWAMKIKNTVLVLFIFLTYPIHVIPEDHRPLIAVGDHNFPPFTYIENGKPAGFDVEVLQAMARRMNFGVEIRLVPWVDAVKMIDEGEADILVGVSASDERRRTFDFTDRMLTMKSSIFVNWDNVTIHDPGDVGTDKEIGVEKGDIMAQFLEKEYKRIRLREFNSQSEAMIALAENKIDMCVLDYYSGLYTIQKNALHRKVKSVGEPLLEAQYCFGVKKGNTKLLSSLNAALENVKNNGELKRIQDSWFGENFFWKQDYFVRIIILIGVLTVIASGILIWNMTLRRSINRKTIEILKSKVELRESEDRFRIAFETSPDAIGISRLKDGVYTDVNRGFTHLLGYTPEEVIGKSSVELGIWTSGERKKLFSDDLMIHGTFRDREIQIKKKGGGTVDALVSAAHFITGGEDRVIVIATDISRLKETESRLRKSLDEKDILLCELYHRTKNNMQLMSSFLKLQLKYAGNKTLEEIVTDADRRIKAMALVHQMLVKSNNLSRISLSDYVTELVGEIFSSFHGRTSGIEPVVSMEPVETLLDAAVPCGIIINEMVSNALKYAFPDGRTGRISIGLRRTAGSVIELEVADDGVGLPADFDPENTSSLGVVILYNVVEQQLHGTIRYESDGGLRWLITFDDGRFVERV